MIDMAQIDRTVTASDCVDTLNAVLGCLDTISGNADDATAQAISFAAIRVQEAIDLMRPVDALSS